MLFRSTVLEETLIEFARYNSYQIAYTAATQDLSDGNDATGRRLGLFNAKSNNIYSFSIKLNEELLRPYFDYTYSGTTVTFLRSFVVSDILVVDSKGYFEYSATIAASGLTAGDRFGHSVSTTTDGRQVLIGTPYKTIDGNVEAGTTYVFDRNVQKFIYGTDTSSVSFTVLSTPTAPVSVSVNGQFLINEAKIGRAHV